VLGWLSDHWGLRNALLITPVALVAAAMFCFLCGYKIAGQRQGR
jgi:MFS family permease